MLVELRRLPVRLRTDMPEAYFPLYFFIETPGLVPLRDANARGSNPAPYSKIVFTHDVEMF
jgi:hypothetical protein